VPDSKDTGEKPWPPEVEMVIDVCDDPPRPFLSRELDGVGYKGDDWREDGDYLTEIYVPLHTVRERLKDAWFAGFADGAENYSDRDRDDPYLNRQADAYLDAAFSKEEAGDD
jgi:hypothetical protein